MPMLDWNSYRKQLVAGVGEIAKISPDTIRGYTTLGDEDRDCPSSFKSRPIFQAMPVIITVTTTGETFP
jgi:hypothetical protein